MNTQEHTTILEQCRDKLRDIIAAHSLNEVELRVIAKELTPEEAIGTPERRDFPIIEGKERMIEALVLGARGQAFTDSPSEFTGRVGDHALCLCTGNAGYGFHTSKTNKVE